MTEIPSRLGLFRAAGGNFALPATALLQVVESPRVYLQGKLPLPLMGLVLSGEWVVPVLQRGGRELADREPELVVLSASSMGMIGFACDQVVQIGSSDLGQFEALETVADSGVIGCFFCQSARYEVIDVDLLVQSLPE